MAGVRAVGHMRTVGERRRSRAVAGACLVHAGAWLWLAAVCQLLLRLG